MYGHAANLFRSCTTTGCTAPATTWSDDGRSLCAADNLAELRAKPVPRKPTPKPYGAKA